MVRVTCRVAKSTSCVPTLGCQVSRTRKLKEDHPYTSSSRFHTSQCRAYRSVQCLCHHMGQFSISVIIWFDIQVSSVSLSSYGLTYRSVQCLYHHMVWHTGQLSVSVIIWVSLVSLLSYGLTYRSVQCLYHHMVWHTGQFSVSIIIWFDIQGSSVSLSSYGSV